MEILIHQMPPETGLSEQRLIEIGQAAANDIDLQGSSCQVIFLDNPALQKMHAEYLDDPTPTDVITFDLGDDAVEGEIYISTDQARENAGTFNESYESELIRLMIHGLLHLKGYDDQADADRAKMKELEDRLVVRYAGNR